MLCVESEAGTTARMEAEAVGHEACAHLLQEAEANSSQKMRMRDPRYSSRDFDFLSATICGRTFITEQPVSTDRASAVASQRATVNRHVLRMIATHLHDPKDLVSLGLTSSLFHNLLLDESDEGEALWERLYEEQFGDAGRKGFGQLWAAVYGQGRPFYGVRTFMEGSWRECFCERTLIATADPCTSRGVDLTLRIHFVSGLAHEGLWLPPIATVPHQPERSRAGVQERAKARPMLSSCCSRSFSFPRTRSRTHATLAL